MPAATTTVAPEPPQPNVWYRPTGDKVLEPFSNPLTAAEHKIRNLEKRKLKLDQYRNEQEEGKTLNADQLAAVAKYSEVIQQLEHNRELVSCLRQVHQQTIKFIKQELRREFMERNKFMLVLNAGLDELKNSTTQNDFIAGEHGAIKLREEDVADLTELTKLVQPSLRESDFSGKIETGAELVAKLFESRGKINNRPAQQLKSLIDSVAECPYFTVDTAPINMQQAEPVEEVVAQPQDIPISVNVPDMNMGHSMVSAQTMLIQDVCSIPTHVFRNYFYIPRRQIPLYNFWDVSVNAQATFTEDTSKGHVTRIIERYDDQITAIAEKPVVFCNDDDYAIVKDREMAYSFMQESQLEIESPHMDPAVVAVSSYAPPPPQLQPPTENNHVFAPPPAEGLNNIQGGMRDLNLNHLNSNSVDEEEDWDEKAPPTTFNNNSAVNGNMEGGEDNTNGFDRSGRGSFRGRGGGRGRGRGNGYGYARPPRSNRGYSHSRYGGTFRPDRIDGESTEYRGKGGRGYTRPFRGNGSAPPLRRGRGAANKPFNNGIHEVRSVDA